MYKSKNLSYFLLAIVFSISITVTIYIIINKDNLQPGYENLFLLPLVYLLAYILFLHKVIYKYGISIFLTVYIFVSFFRYVILSYFIVASGWYLGRSSISPSQENFNRAIMIMIYEVIVYNIFIYIFHNKFFKNKKLNKESVRFAKSSFVYFVFLLVTILLIIIFPDSLRFFSFIKVNNNYVTIENMSSMSAITAICVNVSKLLLYFIIIKFIIYKIGFEYKYTSILLVTLITILNSLVFFGANRSDFIFSFLINILILIYLYKQIGIVISAFLMALLPIIVSKITEYRNSVTITGGSNRLIDFTDTLQVYLAGIYNVAISLELETQTKGIFYLLGDIFRSAIGPNIILKNINIISSSRIFNERIFFNDKVSQIIPMIGQSNLYLGFILSPLLGICFIYFAIYLTKKIIQVKRIELIYVLSLFSGRIGFVMAQNGNILLNDLTFYFPLFLLIYYINNKVVIKNEKS
ncbi:hypothetical protein [Mammaliicoccus sciuri]|uniref:hypothetical protein n=1 Tax=Mammaliicoccus sciuri TaxID=1296 RepID=UPI002DBF07AE|nr:hypothetical protein [Mammaliicoccus sciuri]MEB7965763.1 hypothetical protein [Mammaliicoccus sciuri]